MSPTMKHTQVLGHFLISNLFYFDDNRALDSLLALTYINQIFKQSLYNGNTPNLGVTTNNIIL